MERCSHGDGHTDEDELSRVMREVTGRETDGRGTSGRLLNVL